MSEYTTKDRWTSRKFWAAMAWQGVFTTLYAKGIMPEEIFENLTWLLLGGLYVANVGQSWVHQAYKGEVK